MFLIPKAIKFVRDILLLLKLAVLHTSQTVDSTDENFYLNFISNVVQRL